MPNTTRGYPYPLGTDPADGPGAFQDLAEALDTDVADVETDAAAALNAHAIDATAVHGIADTAALATDTEVATAVANHAADATDVHGIADTSQLYRAGGTDVAVADGGTGASTAAGARANLGAAPLAAPPLTGVVTIDGDVNLYRLVADQLASDDDLVLRPSGARVFIGIAGPSGQSGIALGTGGATDVSLYRLGADQLASDDDLIARASGARVFVGTAGPSGQAGIALGSASDTNLYRSGANELATDDDFQAKNGWMLAHAAKGQKVIGGRVDANGNILLGSGFTVTESPANQFNIAFTTPFAATPLFVASATTGPVDNAAALTASTAQVILSSGVSGWSFIAIGPA